MKRKMLLSMLALLLVAALSVTTSVTAGKKIESKKVELVATTATIGVGDIITLRAEMTPANANDNLRWSTENTQIATVNQYGVVTGISEGSTRITVKTGNKKTASCTVIVKKYLTSQELNALVQDNMLGEDALKEAVMKYGLTKEEVINLIAENSLSQESILALIGENTLTTEDVERIVDGAVSQIPEGLTEDNVNIKSIKSGLRIFF